ncbi:acyl carrier protein [Streptomyces gobiensis]|uniref:acyl carrier protein n=1 Tax=Streptomyces gobiensis TaxID=2875706 RepID=UPI001E5CC218|nr:acyl carrier protein [Streptomyces gobiensis]UGY94201.1 acyl carrier protein [Streptomyces gobiensis]
MPTANPIDEDALRDLIADVLDLEPSVITDDAHFIEDLGVDSLLALELAVTMERHFEIKIESTEIADVVRMRDVVALLSRKLASAV